MNEKALFNLTYGLFLVGTKADGKENACIVNTVIQAASSPVRITLACVNGNLTPELIKKSGYFTVTVLDETAGYPLFQNFGLQHGRDVDKFQFFDVLHDANGMPYITNNANALFSCKVISAEDLGSHTLFLAEVTDAEVLSLKRSATYGEYHTRIRSANRQEQKKEVVSWRCPVCGYIYEGSEIPSDFICPLCHHPAADFEPLYKV